MGCRKAPLLLALFISALGSGCTQTPGGDAIDVEFLYQANCAGCHGPQGIGGTGIAPALQANAFIESGSSEEVIGVIRKGRSFGEKRYKEFASTMPPWEGKLSEEEIDALAGYLKGL